MNDLLNNMYFVNAGEKCGQFIILLEFDSKTKTYSILGLPESEAIYIIQKDINMGIEHKILDFVQKLPKDVIKDCKNEFQYRINNK
jgi:hypothetical protein